MLQLYAICIDIHMGGIDTGESGLKLTILVSIQDYTTLRCFFVYHVSIRTLNLDRVPPYPTAWPILSQTISTCLLLTRI